MSKYICDHIDCDHIDCDHIDCDHIDWEHTDGAMWQSEAKH